jgi:hypothetical protein
MSCAQAHTVVVWLDNALSFLQAQEQLGLCCNVPTYAPLEPPASWQQQQQQQGELVIPDLPDLSRVLGPLQQVNCIARGMHCNAVDRLPQQHGFFYLD